MRREVWIWDLEIPQNNQFGFALGVCAKIWPFCAVWVLEIPQNNNDEPFSQAFSSRAPTRLPLQ
jgi:hypothetical protein